MPSNHLQGPGGGGSSTFTSSESGAVTRTIPDKLQEFVSVKDFGAVGDGVTDDTVAFQAAIDATYGTSNTRRGRTLFVPSGRYKITSTLTLCPASGASTFRMVGDGAVYKGYSDSYRLDRGAVIDATEILDGIAIQTISGATNGVRGVEIENIAICGPGQFKAGVNSVGFRWNESCTKLTMRDCLINGFHKGLELGGAGSDAQADEVSLNDCWIHRNWYGVYCESLQSTINNIVRTGFVGNVYGWWTMVNEMPDARFENCFWTSSKDLPVPRRWSYSALSSYTFTLTAASTVNVNGVTRGTRTTVTTATAHGLFAGEYAWIESVGGTTALNCTTVGWRILEVPTTTSMILEVDTSAAGAYTSGGTVAPVPAPGMIAMVEGGGSAALGVRGLWGGIPWLVTSSTSTSLVTENGSTPQSLCASTGTNTLFVGWIGACIMAGRYTVEGGRHEYEDDTVENVNIFVIDRFHGSGASSISGGFKFNQDIKDATPTTGASAWRRMVPLVWQLTGSSSGCNTVMIQSCQTKGRFNKFVVRGNAERPVMRISNCVFTAQALYVDTQGRRPSAIQLQLIDHTDEHVWGSPQTSVRAAETRLPDPYQFKWGAWGARKLNRWMGPIGNQILDAAPTWGVKGHPIVDSSGVTAELWVPSFHVSMSDTDALDGQMATISVTVTGTMAQNSNAVTLSGAASGQFWVGAPVSVAGALTGPADLHATVIEADYQNINAPILYLSANCTIAGGVTGAAMTVKAPTITNENI